MPDTTPILEAQVCECGHLRSEHEPSVRQAYLWRNIGPFVCVHTSNVGPHGLDDDGWPEVCMCTEFIEASELTTEGGRIGMTMETLGERVAAAIREAANELEGGHGWPEYAAENALAALGLADLDAAVERGARGLHLDYKREGKGGTNRALSRENLRAVWDQVVIKSWYRRKARAVLEAALALTDEDWGK